MTFGNFADHLLAELERLAKWENQNANQEYATALAGGYRIDGGRVFVDEDAAFEACARTARLCDLADEMRTECADIYFDRRTA